MLILKTALEHYLKESIDENIRIQPWEGKKKLPLFLLGIYDFYQTEILGKHCIFVEIMSEAPGIETLKKHAQIMHKEIDGHLVFFYKSITRFRRKSLIEHRIPFVVEDRQMYLPFLGFELREVIDTQVKKAIKFSSSTQLAFLYFLYNNNVTINATELAEVLNTSIMTASRALNDLYDARLLTYELGGKTERSKKYKKIDNPEYYNEGSTYLKSPVKQTVYVGKKIGDALVAGLEALSMMSMINPPDHPVRAIPKERFNEIAPVVIKNKDRIADEKLVELEIWNYDPALISNNEYVDIASLAASLKDNQDERIEQALEERLNCEKWYMG